MRNSDWENFETHYREVVRKEREEVARYRARVAVLEEELAETKKLVKALHEWASFTGVEVNKLLKNSGLEALNKDIYPDD